MDYLSGAAYGRGVILDSFAGSQFSYAAGVSGTVTVPAGVFVRSIRALGAGGATLVITPQGPNQSNTAGSSIPLPSSTQYWECDFLGELGPGTTLAFTSTASYFVSYAKFKAGGP